ncbi:Mitochondrial matrix cochaperone [Ascosphaera aggregata]|nr:Mitochondrial matrix cochaperone [Ascosphaera aggregata]
MIPRSLLRQTQAVFSSRATTAALRSAFPRFSFCQSQALRNQSHLLRSSVSISRIVAGRRWASTESKEGEATKEEEKKQEIKEETLEEKLRKEIEEKNKEIIALKDKYLRSVADFQNLQGRAERDIAASKQFGIQKFAADLLDSIDNLDRALNAVPADKLVPTEDGANKELIELHSGLKMTERVLFATLKKHGVERYDPMEPVEGSEGKAQKFDPALHEATFQTPMPGKEDGDVMYTQSKGFMLNGRVLRVSEDSESPRIPRSNANGKDI